MVIIFKTLVVLWKKQSCCASVPLGYYPNSPIIWEFIFGEQPFAVFESLVIAFPVFLAYVAPISICVADKIRKH